jgi:outer membrane protein assembly factor BamD
VLADSEMRVAAFYHHKGSFPAAVNRYKIVDQYPLYSGADDALWNQADSYSRMGPRFRQKAGESYARIVRDYPLSGYAENAKKRLKELEMPIPEADPVALNRMKYEQENRTKAGITNAAFGIIKRGPDTHFSAKSGTPTMTPMRPSVPDSVPQPAAAAGFTGDVTVQPVTDTTALDTKPDARQVAPAQGGTEASAAPVAPAAAQDQQPLPVNHQPLKPKKQKKSKKQQQQVQPASTPPAQPASPQTTPAADPGKAATPAPQK